MWSGGSLGQSLADDILCSASQFGELSEIWIGSRQGGVDFAGYPGIDSTDMCDTLLEEIEAVHRSSHVSGTSA